MVRIIHSADWQLGKPFGRFDPDVRSALSEARFDAIDQIGAAAAERGVAHVLVAGDVFDNAGPADREIVQALTRMGRADCQWWLLPGNHDYVRAGGLWDRVRTRAPASVHVLDTSDPMEIETGVWILPAPLEHRRTRDDPTEAFTGMATPPEAIRIGLAHGSVVDFAQRGEADNFIPPDRASQSGLDYLALGDWHGHLQVGDRTAYSGTPEVDRFGRDDLGSINVVEVHRHAAASIERIETGRYRWLERSWHVDDLEAFSSAWRSLSEAIDPANTLLKLNVVGTASLQDRVRILAEGTDRLSHALRWLLMDSEELIARPSEDDISTLTVEGTLGLAAKLLQQKDAAGEVEAGLASKALERLYVETVRAGAGS